MRLFLGILIGCALTVGVAYIADATSARSAANGELGRGFNASRSGHRDGAPDLEKDSRLTRSLHSRRQNAFRLRTSCRWNTM